MTTVPKRELAAFLIDLDDVGYAVAKAPDLWANLERGGDWDLVVRDVDSAVRLLTGRLGQPLSVVRRSYVTSAYYPWGHIDLLPEIAWRGVLLADAEDVLRYASQGTGGVWTASVAHQICAACVYPALAHGGYRDRYAGLFQELTAEDGEVLARALRTAFGPRFADTTAVLDPSRLASLRRNAVARSLASSRGWRRWSHFFARELWLRTVGRGGGGAQAGSPSMGSGRADTGPARRSGT